VDAGAEFIEHKREELAHTFHDVADEASKTVSNLSSKAHSTAESTASHTFSDVTETVTHAFSDVKEKISEVIADHDDVTTEVKDILEKAVTPNPGVSEKMPPYEWVTNITRSIIFCSIVDVKHDHDNTSIVDELFLSLIYKQILKIVHINSSYRCGSLTIARCTVSFVRFYQVVYE